jgi:hypothetical protein
VDPANSNNVISDELEQQPRQLIANQAKVSLGKRTWGEIVI